MKKLLVGLVAVFICTFAIAQTETINWYKDGQNYEQTTCESGGDVILPTAPTKRGYNFIGWVPVYDFSTLGYTFPQETATYTANASNNTWTVARPNDIIYGISFCSGTYAATRGDIGIPEDFGSRQYCWCKITGVQPNESDVLYEPIAPLPWVFTRNDNSWDRCSKVCAGDCGGDFQRKNLSFRQALLGIQ